MSRAQPKVYALDAQMLLRPGSGKDKDLKDVAVACFCQGILLSNVRGCAFGADILFLRIDVFCTCGEGLAALCVRGFASAIFELVPSCGFVYGVVGSCTLLEAFGGSPSALRRA